MKQEVLYVAGYVEDNAIWYIGWNKRQQSQDAVCTKYFTKRNLKSDDFSLLCNKVFVYKNVDHENVYVYCFDTKEDAEYGIYFEALAQVFQQNIVAIKLVQDNKGNWYPEFGADNNKDSNKDIAKNLIRLTKQEAYDLALKNDEAPKFAEYLAKTHLWFRTNAVVDGKKEHLYISFIHKPTIATTLYYRDDTAAPTISAENFKAYNHKYNNEYPSWTKMLQAIDEGLNSPLSKQKHEAVETIPELYEKRIGFGSTLVVPHIILHKTTTTDIYRTHISFYINDTYFAGVKDKQIAIIEFDKDTLQDLRNILVELMNNFDKRLDTYFKRYRNNISTYGYWADR